MNYAGIIRARGGYNYFAKIKKTCLNDQSSHPQCAARHKLIAAEYQTKLFGIAIFVQPIRETLSVSKTCTSMTRTPKNVNML